MSRTFVPLILLGTLAVFARGATAHSVETTDGTVHEGRIVTDDDDKIVIVTTFDGRVTIPRADVKSVDKTTPPLRDQLEFRAQRAKDDPEKLWDLHRWAKQKGFTDDLRYILLRIVELEPKDARAHKLLGHEKVDGEWMSPEEKEAHLRAKQEAEMRARGLVEHEGRWVTPEEKEAIETGLRKDGDEWVSEEEYHRRRGEELVDGKWVRLGEKEGKAWAEELAASRVSTQYLWSPHFDAFYDVKEEHAKRALEGAEKAYDVFRRTLRPAEGEYLGGVAGRIRLHLFNKLPAYARFAQFFETKAKCEELVKGWLPAVRRQHSFWWVDPVDVVGVYKFPNTPRTFVSNAVHNVGYILLTRYRFNYRFPRWWLLEGFAYYLEMEALGYSATFSLARQGTAASGTAGRPVWADSDEWRNALKTLVAEGRDPPMKRIARMGQDQLGYVELVKSWSVVECLVRLDRAKFEAFIDADKDRAKTMEDALKEVYGFTWRTLDRKWRSYVSAGFTHGGAAPGGAEGTK